MNIYNINIGTNHMSIYNKRHVVFQLTHFYTQNLYKESIDIVESIVDRIQTALLYDFLHYTIYSK